MCQDSLHKMEAAEGGWEKKEKSDRKEVEFRRLHNVRFIITEKVRLRMRLTSLCVEFMCT